MTKIITIESLRQERRDELRRLAEYKQLVPYRWVGGEMRAVPLVWQQGDPLVPEFDRPVGELMTLPSGYEAVIQNSVINVALGREALPILYTPIYGRLQDRNLTQHVDITGLNSGRAQAVFLEKMEGEEIKFGARTFQSKDVVPLAMYATGFQWTYEMTLWDKTWEVAETGRAVGEAYNALLNHLHLYPIISYAYAAKNQTPADATGANLYEKTRLTLQNAFQNAALDVDTETRRGRRPSVLLAHSSRRFQIEDALQRRLIGGTDFPALSGIDTVIYYDGYSITVGEKTYTYGGCPTGKGYLIEPKTWFRELVKIDLENDSGNADVSRLIGNQFVWWTVRGVFASPANAVEEITWP